MQCDLKKHFEKTKGFQILIKKPEYFEHVQMQPGGYGVAWDVNLSISDSIWQEYIVLEEWDIKEELAVGIQKIPWNSGFCKKVVFPMGNLWYNSI